MSLLVVYCLLVTIASLAGGWLPSVVQLTHQRMQMLMSTVSGLMLGVAVLHLLPHAVVHLKSLDKAGGWLMVGLLTMFFLIRAFHPHSHGVESVEDRGSPRGCDGSLDHLHGHSAMGLGSATRRISWVGAALGLTLHTLIDGAALAAAVVADQTAGDEHTLAGLGTFLAVALHKPLDSLSITSLMAAQGWGPAIRQRVNLAYSLACPLGAALFWIGLDEFSSESSPLVGAALAFAAGVFLCIALADLLPEVEYHSHDRLMLSAALLAGILAAYAIGFFEPSHPHDLIIETDGHGRLEHDHSLRDQDSHYGHKN